MLKEINQSSSFSTKKCKKEKVNKGKNVSDKQQSKQEFCQQCARKAETLYRPIRKKVFGEISVVKLCKDSFTGITCEGPSKHLMIRVIL